MIWKFSKINHYQNRVADIRKYDLLKINNWFGDQQIYLFDWVFLSVRIIMWVIMRVNGVSESDCKKVINTWHDWFTNLFKISLNS